MKKIILSVLLLCCANLSAQEADLPCNVIDTFVPFKAGVKAAKSNNHELAFDIFCNLSFKGDYRAQFRLAKYYDGSHASIEETNKVYAWVWANLSNAMVKSTQRAGYIAQLKSQLSADELQLAQKLWRVSKHKIPTGIRLDQQFEPLNYEKLLRKHNRKTEYTGSRIKKETPPKNLGIFLVN